MVPLDHDEEMGTMHGMHGTLDAELEVRRTIKRAELTAFLCLLRKAIGPTMVHVDKKGINDGLWKGRNEMYWSESKKTPICGSQFGKNWSICAQRTY